MRYKKVLLLFPDYKGGYFGALRPPAGIGYLAQILQEEGIEYDVLDMATGCELTAIEPFPNKELRKGFPGFTRLIENRVQSVALKEFEDCDLLFIDSSHVVKINSDVNYEILEIIPRLKKNCLVHFHDIFLPGEYWKLWVKKNKRFWTEQYLLQAFLQFNSDFEIIWASKYQHLNNKLMIRNVFPYFKPDEHLITSFWIRRKT